MATWTYNGRTFSDQPSYPGQQSYNYYNRTVVSIYEVVAPPTSVTTPASPAPPEAVSSVTGIDPNEIAGATYGKIIPIWVGGLPRLGCHIVFGPQVTITGGVAYASFGVSFGMPANNTGAREIRELRLDGVKVWSLSDGSLLSGLTFRFYGGTETQAADPLVSAAFPTAAVAHRGHCMVFIESLALTQFANKIPFVSAVIADITGGADPTDGVGLGHALTQLAASPYVNLGTENFETVDISERVDALIIAERVSFVELLNRFARLFIWDVVQQDKLRVIERGSVTIPDFTLDLTQIQAGGGSDNPPLAVERSPQSDVQGKLEYSYIDIDRDYEINSVTVKKMVTPAPTTVNEGKTTVSLPIVHTIQEALSWATLRNFRDELAREKIAFTTGIYGYEIEPGDIGIVDAGFKRYAVRVIETLKGANWTNRIIAEPVIRCILPIGVAPLDGLACVTGGWSLSRDLLSSFEGEYYTEISDAVARIVDQTGLGHHFDDGGASTRPVPVEAGPNDRMSADFDGSDDYMDTSAALSEFITNNAAYVIISVMIDAVTLDEATVQDNHGVVGDAGQKMGIYARDLDGLTVYAFNFNGSADSAARDKTLGVPLVISWRHESGTLYVRTNNGTEVSVASGNTSDLTGHLRLAMTAASTNTNMKFWELATFDCAPSLAVRNALERNFMDWVGAANDDAGEFVPTDLPELRIWYRGDDLVGADGSTILTWTDATGNGNDASVSGGNVLQQDAVLNGMNVAEFNSTWLHIGGLSGFPTVNGGTIFYVLKADSDPAGGDGPASIGSHADANHYPFGDGTIYNGDASTTRKAVGNPSTSLAQFNIVSIVSATNDWRYYLNGELLFSTATNTVAWGGVPFLGFGGGIGWEGMIAEFMVVAEALDTADRQSVEGYVAHKWALTDRLPSDHPYKTNPP